MGKSKQSSRRHQSRSPRSSTPKRKTRGLRMLLAITLLLLAVLLLRQMPPGILIVGSISILCLFLLVLTCWFWFRTRPGPEELRSVHEKNLEAAQFAATAQMIGVRPIERLDLLHLDPKEFEYFVGDLLEAMEVLHDWECVGKGGDHGVDLRGKNQYNLPLVVQCKRFKNKVTPDLTRDFGWTLSLHQANEAWFVTTSFFTDQARQDVASLTLKGHMKLINGDTLIEYIRAYWSALPEKWQWRLTECIQQRV